MFTSKSLIVYGGEKNSITVAEIDLYYRRGNGVRGPTHSSWRHPFSLAFLTSLFTSCERARVVTSRVSGISTITRSSTPRHATSRPEPGTTMPPATCSVRTIRAHELAWQRPLKHGERTQSAVAKNTGLVCLCRQKFGNRREVSNIIPTCGAATD